MSVVALMSAAWAASILFVFILKIYSASLSRNEDDQLALSASSINLRSEQAAIAERIQKLQPLQKMSYVLVGLLTLSMIGYLAFDIYRRFS